MKIQVIFLSESLDLSGSTTWMNTLIKAFQERGIPCAHLVVGRKKTIQSKAQTSHYTGQPRKYFRFRVMRYLQVHKIFKAYYAKKEDDFYNSHAEGFLDSKISNKVLVIKDFSSYLPKYFCQEKFIVAAVLHHQYFSFDKGYHFDHLIAVSQAVMDKSNEIGFDVEKVIYNPLDSSLIKSESNAYEVEEKEYLLFVGRLYDEKGVCELLKAYHQLINESKINKKLIFIGTGKSQAKLESYIQKHGLEDKVFFKGFLVNPYPYIKNADLLILPSYSESMGYVAIEAAVLQTSYLVSNYPAAKEFFPECNIFEMNDNKDIFVDNLKVKIVQLLLCPRHRLQAGVEYKMRINTVVEEYINMLE